MRVWIAGPIVTAMTSLAAQTALDHAVPARPFLKWAGGKTQLLTHILPWFPDHFNRYFEPFVGGGAVFFAVQPRKAFLSDVNPNLVDAYLAIRDDVDGVIRHLKRHSATEEHFYKVRAQDPAKLSRLQRAARMIFLNRTCFNGLYRVNKSGKFNVPFGKYSNPRICNVENLERVSESLQGTDIRLSSVFDSALRARKGDLVYFDPPYVPLTPTASFTSYTAGGFGQADQVRLAEMFGRLARRGVHVVLSNSDTPLVRDLYKHFHTERVYARRAINSRATGRGRVAEVIVVAP